MVRYYVMAKALHCRSPLVAYLHLFHIAFLFPISSQSLRSESLSEALLLVGGVKGKLSKASKDPNSVFMEGSVLFLDNQQGQVWKPRMVSQEIDACIVIHALSSISWYSASERARWRHRK